ncbi:MATE family efflux transporter [Methylobrevis pamukkalensis]|uniref:Multidrug resistance protein MdtK n=1 Tax=Methylobrevis pamukkalensis TaxID=1439726 RepID=A0A1E3H583_9HYPH|nr:MATE family efflux transporter [Methylobrevis pamukkalensis]ODN70671.1 Multidrug resistance protein MdtK [Methylobrevis pamukkalensis]
MPDDIPADRPGAPAPAAAPIPPTPFARHVRRTLVLALPIVVSRAGAMLLITTDTLAAGHVGTMELAAIALGLSPQLVLFMVMMGALQVTVMLAATAQGEGRPERIGAVLVTAILHAFVLGLLTIPLAFLSEAFFLGMGQEPQLAAEAGAVAITYVWGVPGFMAFLVTAMVIETAGKPAVATAMILAANALNIGLDALLVNGLFGVFPETGAVMATATTSVLRWGLMLAAFAYVLVLARRRGDPWRLLPALRNIGNQLRTAGGENGRIMRRLGLPMGLAQGVESAAFNTLVMMAGLIAPAVLAAHQATMTAVTLSYMTAVGFAGAAAIRVGNALGARNAADVRRAAWTAIGFGGGTALVSGLLLFTLPRQIAPLLASDPALLGPLADALRVAGVVVIFDSMMGVSLGVLRGVGDAWRPLILQCLAFWLVAIPVAWLCTLRLDLGAAGLQIAILSGVAVSFLLLALRIVDRTRHLPGVAR